MTGAAARVAGVIAGAIGRQAFDVVPVLAELPRAVVAALLGLPDTPALTRWAELIGGPTGASGTAETLRLITAARDAHGQVRTALERGRPAGASRLPQAALPARLAEAGLAADERFGLCSELVYAAQGTTTAALSAVMLALVELGPDARVSLGSMVNEVIRLHSPVQYVPRVATGDIEICGVRIRRRERVLLCLGSANRDPEHFRDPDRFVPGRQEGGQLAFGAGPHACIGARLARAEVVALLAQLRGRLGWGVTAEAEWVDRPGVRALAALRLGATAEEATPHPATCPAGRAC
jgi:cytochrome P450